jgi:hypothetical protein
MTESIIKLVIQFIISPLVLAVIGVLTSLYRRDLKYLKDAGEQERIGRKEETEKLFTKIDDINKKMSDINKTLGNIKGRIIAQEKICNIRHKDKEMV